MLAPALKRNGDRGAVRAHREEEKRPSLLIQMATRIGRDSAFYTAVTGSVFPIAFVNAILFTHYMTTSQYGQLAVLFFVSGLMTVVLNLFFLRGTERQVWGASDEGVDVDVAELVEVHERPRVLGTGLWMSVVVGCIAVALTVPFASQLSQLLVQTPDLGKAVIWTSVSGAIGGTWRLAANIGRWERRRRGFGLVWILRPSLALIVGFALVATGHGVTGAVAGTAIGTAISLLVGLVISRRSYQPVMDRHAFHRIARSSANFAAMVIGLFILHNGDVFMLSRFASSADVGIYKLATNITSVISYAVSAFLMAWSPLEFSTLFKATYERHGKERLRGEFAHYYLIFGIFMVLLLAALATPLISLFAASYSSASGYVAITGLGYLAYGIFLVIARSSSFPRRYFVYGVAALASGAGLVITSFVLGPSIGGYGVAIGDTVGGLAGIAVIVFVAAIWGDLPAVNPFRIIGLLLVGGACWALGGPVADQAGSFDAVLKIASVILFPLGLLATGVIPPSQRGALLAILRNSVRRGMRPHELIARTARLPRTEGQVLLALTRDHERVTSVSARTGLPDRAVRLTLIAALRRLSAAGPPTADDYAISEFLLDTDSITERDAIARALWDEGVEPVDLHEIDFTFRALYEAPASAWPATTQRRRLGRRESEWSLDPQATRLLDALVREGRDRGQVAEDLGLTSLELDRRLVGALRQAGENGHRAHGPADAMIGSYLLDGSDGPPTGQLWAAGVDPIELQQLELKLAQIRSLSGRQWRRAATGTVGAAVDVDVVNGSG
jgi:O-antigen/teichoic acid export membrane protein